MTICFLRTAILYLLLIAAVRLMGKKQVGELEPTELVFAMLLSDLASVPMQDFGIPLLYGVLPIVILLCITMVLSMLSLRSILFRQLLCGKPCLIVRNGVPDQTALARCRFTVDELLEELRLKGVTDLSSVKYAVLENSGEVSVILFDRETPVTPEQLNLEVQEDGLPLIIISDGNLLRYNLTRLGHDEGWLREKLREQGLTSVRSVFLFTADENGQVCILPKEGNG